MTGLPKKCSFEDLANGVWYVYRYAHDLEIGGECIRNVYHPSTTWRPSVGGDDAEGATRPASKYCGLLAIFDEEIGFAMRKFVHSTDSASLIPVDYQTRRRRWPKM